MKYSKNEDAMNLENNKLSNPFEYTRPITDTSRAIVRSSHLEKLITHIRRSECVSVLAPRQSGKSTFLFQAREKLLANNTVVYLDFEDFYNNDFGKLIDRLVRKATESCKLLTIPKNYRSMLDFINMLKLWEKTTSIIFLIDELPSVKEVAYQFLAAIRVYYQDFDSDRKGIHKFVIAGSTDLADLAQEINPFVSPFNIAVEIYLDDFTEPEVFEYINKNAPGVFPPEDIQKIFDYSRGHPYLLQFICYNLWGKTPKERKSILGNISDLKKQLRLEDTINIQSMVNHFASDPERYKVEINFIRRISQQERLPFTISNRVIRNLVMQGIIAEKDNECVIRNPIYDAVFQLNFIIGDRIADLKIEQPRHYEDFFNKLKNFIGWISIDIWEGNRQVQYQEDQNLFFLKSYSQYELKVTIAKGIKPIEKSDHDGLSVDLLISDGENADEQIGFSVRPESFYKFDLGNEQTRFFSPQIKEITQTFKFPINTYEPTASAVQLFLSVYQDVSLVQALRILLNISAADDSN
jgi:hypothetical protein